LEREREGGRESSSGERVMKLTCKKSKEPAYHYQVQIFGPKIFWTGENAYRSQIERIENQ
jgi:hypothetical protein